MILTFLIFSHKRLGMSALFTALRVECSILDTDRPYIDW